MARSIYSLPSFVQASAYGTPNRSKLSPNIWRSSRERLSALTNVRVNVYLNVHVNVYANV